MAYDFLRTKLSVEIVEKVERMLQEGKSYSSISQLTGVSKASISRIKNGNYTKFEKEFDITQEPQYQRLERHAKNIESELTFSKLTNTTQEKNIQSLKCEIEKLEEEIRKLKARLSLSKSKK